MQGAPEALGDGGDFDVRMPSSDSALIHDGITGNVGALPAFDCALICDLEGPASIGGNV